MTKKPAVTQFELEAYCDGELDDADVARVNRALEADPELRARLGEVTRQRSALLEASDDGLGETDPAVALLTGKLEKQIHARHRQWMMRSVAAGVAAVVLVGAAGWFGHARLAPAGPTQIGEFTLPAFVADAAGAHSIFAFDAVHPVEFTSSDEAIMRAWFAHHLGKEASVPHLEELGFDLVGGRLLGDAEGAMAQILYENQAGDRVSLVYGKRAVAGGKELKLVKVGKSFASYWRSGDFAWAVIEDTPGADVSAIATHVATLVNDSRS